MKNFPAILLAVILISSCKQKQIPLLNANNLPSSFVTIDAAKEYKLKTPKGAVVKIPANCFKVPAGTSVKIEMKEAYNMQDIMAAGLSTRSNGRLLQSGGMVYFNATADGKAVEFAKAVSITTLATVYNKDMQLFTGDVGKDGSINWVNPAPLDTTPIAKYMGNGEALFKANCSNCHKPVDDATGPALAGARQRAPDKNWPYKFVDNVNSMLDYDVYARFLLQKYGSRMTQFNLEAEDIKRILDYCDNEAVLYNPALLNAKPFPGGGAITECGFDTIQVPMPDTTFQDFKEDSVLNQMDDVGDATTAVFNIVPESPEYSFSIKSSGWYNIDYFMKDYKSFVTSVKLTVDVLESITKEASVNLCIPSRNLLTKAAINEDGSYDFGDIQLIPGDAAFIFVVDQNESEIRFGSRSFKVQAKQQIEVELKTASKASILDAFKRNNLDGVSIDLNKKRVELILPPGNPGPVTKSSLPDSIAKKVEWQVIKRYCDISIPSGPFDRQ